VRYHELPGGHLVFLSQYERVRAEIAEFLRARARKVAHSYAW
jgi:hypothetical protein